MRILTVHNYYQQPGGEDQVFRNEALLLERNGNTVIQYTLHNDIIKQMSRISTATSSCWNSRVYKHLRGIIRQTKPDIIHFHNTFPLISPAAYHAARKENVPIIQTLHNYRLLCLNALLFRQGQICELCIRKYVPWPGILYSCYRQSRSASIVVASMIFLHKFLRTWKNLVHTFIALSNFSRQKFIQGGLPESKIKVKSNFLAQDPGVRDDNNIGEYAVFVGRLSHEKGIMKLLQTWKTLDGIPIKIIGDGPLKNIIQAYIQKHQLYNTIELLGHLPNKHVLNLIKGSRFLIFPSECYENFPMSIIEAFACGVPVIAHRSGSTPEIINEHQTGLLFSFDTHNDLANNVKWAWNNPHQLTQMSKRARNKYISHFSAEKNYDQLLAIYNLALDEKYDHS